MRKVVLCVATGAVALTGSLLPASAGSRKDTKTSIETNGFAYLEVKGDPNQKVGGPGIAKLRKNGNILKTDPFTFEKNSIGGGGGLGYFKELYADKDGKCSLFVKYKGNDDYAPSTDTMEVTCRKPE